MRQIKALTIEDLIKTTCRKKNIPYRKSMYRAAKKAYTRLPWMQKVQIAS